MSSNPAIVDPAVTPREALGLLRELAALRQHRFWADDLDFTGDDLPFRLVFGHRQVTDAYLLGLAIARDARLVTLDRTIGDLLPADSPHRQRILLLTRCGAPRSHPIIAEEGSAAGIDPDFGRLWFGESIVDIAQQEAEGVYIPLHFVRLGSKTYTARGGAADHRRDWVREADPCATAGEREQWSAGIDADSTAIWSCFYELGEAVLKHQQAVGRRSMMSRATRSALRLAAAVALFFTGHSAIADLPVGEKKSQVNYASQIVLLVHKSGVAVVEFSRPVQDGVSYRYRFLSKGAPKEQNGTGSIAEVYVKDKSRKARPGVQPVKPGAGHHPVIHAGKLSVLWSPRTLTSGWIYYGTPPGRVAILDRAKFEKLDLSKLLQ